MLGNFRSIFNPTPEDVKRKREQYKEIFKRSYDEKWCSSCANSIQVDINEHGRLSYDRKCEIHDWKTKHGCKDYISDGRLNELLLKLDE